MECLEDVLKVIPEKFKKVVAKLKPGKADTTFSFSSDCLKVKSGVLAEQIAAMIRSFLIRNHIPQFFLLSTLIPIIKDKLVSMNISKNLCSVCLTSLFLKQVDWIIIHLYGDILGFHNLQFAFTGAFGYSDDDIFLAPSVLSLQELLKIAETYCDSHGLKFSTDQIPKKSKTKCIAWLKEDRTLPSKADQ